MKKFLFLISLIIVLASCQKEEEKQPDLTVVDILQSVLDFFAPANQTEDIKPQQHQNRTKPCQPVKSWKHLNHTRKPYCVIPPKPHFNHTKPHFNHTKPHFNHTKPHFNHTHRYTNSFLENKE